MAIASVARVAEVPTLSLRERGLHDRRARVLDAAEALIRETGSTDFTVAALAARAVLSGPTPYNLFGSKGAILYALLNRSLDPVFAGELRISAERDPVARVMAAANLSVDVFVGDPVFYRPLYQFLLGVGDAVQRPAFLERSRQFWLHALDALVETERFVLPRRGQGLARMMVLNFMSALELWVHHELDHDQLRAQVLYGTATLLLGFATEGQRASLLRQMRALERQLPGAFAQSGPM
jgi:AcrR family transcriptional regulator